VANTKRAKSKSGRRRSAASVSRTSRKAVDLALIRERIQNQVGNAASGMVASGIEEANKGHYAAMKFLFELVGLYPTVEGAEEGEAEDGLARTLFRRLGVAEEGLTGDVTDDAERTPGSEANAVE
jgi:hypothetical protein